jgi:hypothetical protein
MMDIGFRVRRGLVLAGVASCAALALGGASASAHGPAKYCDQVLINSHGICQHGANHLITRTQSWSTGTARACTGDTLVSNGGTEIWDCTTVNGGTADSGFHAQVNAYPWLYNNSTFISRFSGNFYYN